MHIRRYLCDEVTICGDCISSVDNELHIVCEQSLERYRS